MFATDLICSNGHRFEACFSNRAAFELQKKEELIECPHCGDISIEGTATKKEEKELAGEGVPFVEIPDIQ